MDRVFDSGASATPPSPPASPSSGYPTAGNPATAVPATKPGKYWYYMITEELRKVVEDAGLTPDHSNISQLSQAIQAMIANGAVNAYKTPCRVATVGVSITLVGGAPSTLDGITLVAGDRVLVKDQGTGSQNGIYYVTTLGTGSDGTWTRSSDADQVGELVPGAIIPVSEGATNADTLWMLTTDGTITIGTTALAFSRKDSNSPGSVSGSFSNLQASATGSGSNVAVSADELALESSGGDYVTAKNVSVTINTAGSGANGLDTGSLAASTWYAMFIIRKPDGTTAGLISLSSTAPTLPSGYTFKARVGWIRTDGTGNKYPLGFVQKGRQVQYLIGSGNVSAMPIMASGAAGSAGTPTWVAVAHANFVPSTASRIRGASANESSYIVMAAPNGSFGSYLSATNPPPVVVNPMGGGNSLPFDFAIESSNIYWCNNGAGRLHCLGWEDNL